MKLVKIKNLPNKIEIIKWLTELILESESSYCPLIEQNNLPNENFYVIVNTDIIPAYISTKNNEALVLWVHKDFRNKGYAKFMINTLGIKYTIAAPSSIPFWQKLGFKRKNNSSSGPIMMSI